MYAVVETGGKQYKVQAGDVIKVEKLAGEPGEQVILDRVLMVSDGAGELKIGSPCVENAQVVGQILLQDRDKKIIVFKFKKRKNYRRKQGHRQAFTKIKIESING